MPGLSLDYGGIPSADTLFRLSRHSPDGLLFPKLEWLHWDVDGADPALPFFRLFFSPRLRRITFYIDQAIDVAAFAQVISALPTSLESLDIDPGHGDAEPVKDALSSFICQCGSSLRSFGTCGSLSDVATLHLAQPPNLSRWKTDQGPPQVTSTPVLQSLEHLHLNGEGAMPWLRFLASNGKGIGERLESLDLPRGTAIDSTFLSPVVSLRNLVKLLVRSAFCRASRGCSFRLTDDNVKDLAAALPRLQSLQLRSPCHLNTCKTTVASLMSISIHCPDLLDLQIHFNTQAIVDDMQALLDGGVGRNKTKCRLRSLLVGIIPLKLDSAGLQIVAKGFCVIFPHMETLENYSHHWSVLRLKMREVGGHEVEAELAP